jgi:hypothetical protein
MASPVFLNPSGALQYTGQPDGGAIDIQTIQQIQRSAQTPFGLGTNGLTALSGGGQTGATQLLTGMNRITTVAAAGDSCQLPHSFPGGLVIVINDAANPTDVYVSAGSTDVVGNLSDAQYVSIPGGTSVIFMCAVLGYWNAGSGFSGSSVPQAITGAGAIYPHASATYVITDAAAAALTLAAPTATQDDGTTIVVTSNTAYAHTITATGLLYTGTASVNEATFAAHPGASVTLYAYQGHWLVLSSNAITFS